jgi:hypothetical protein
MPSQPVTVAGFYKGRFLQIHSNIFIAGCHKSCNSQPMFFKVISHVFNRAVEIFNLKRHADMGIQSWQDNVIYLLKAGRGL